MPPSLPDSAEVLIIKLIIVTVTNLIVEFSSIDKFFVQKLERAFE